MNRNVIIIIGLLLVATGAFLSYVPEGKYQSVDFNGDFELTPAGSQSTFNEFAKKVSDSGYGSWYSYPMIGAKALEEVSYMTDSTADAGSSGSVNRYSETNVQVLGVDEADIVKTNGELIFYTTQSPVWVSSYWGQNTYVIDALPAESAKIIGNISEGGNLYLDGNNLIILSYDKIMSYDITNPEKPELKWAKDLNGTYVDSRLIDGQLYLIVQEYGLDEPIIWDNMEVDYSDVYIPRIPDIIRPNFDSTYIVSSINAENGEVKDTVVLIGSYSNTIYVSEENIYFAYTLNYDEDKLMLKFITENGDKYFPSEVTSILSAVISSEYFGDEAKYLQMTEIIQSYLLTLSSEDRNNLMNEIENDYNVFLKENWEELEGTGIAKIELDTFEVTSGRAPGTLLNSFSMDEYEGNLRVATTIGNDWRYRDIQTNNIYVFDKDMKIIGKLTGLEEGERIYSARFMGDKAYVVTYKETDPLLVIDLENPKNPKVLGELKIPGYSTYLHPIGDNKVIGIGKNDQNMLKVSLFDITDLENPKEIAKYNLNEYWSTALYEHHAFLWDSEKEIMVLPAGSHAFVLQVNENGIKMLKDEVHKDYNVLRSLYINDYLYTFSEYEIHIIDQNTWKTVKTINLPRYDYPYYYEPYIDTLDDISEIKTETIDEKLSVGENLTITLDENPTTGYTWNYEISDENKIVIASDNYIESENEEIVGAGGIHEWTFSALDSGEVEVTFNYYRSWEGAKSSISKKVYKITIE